MIMDPGPPNHYMPHPFVRAQQQQQQQEQVYHNSSGGGNNNSIGGSSLHRGDIPPAPTPHHSHGPPPPGWIERQRSTPTNGSTGNNQNPLRRSPRGSSTSASFRFDGGIYASTAHHIMHQRHFGGGGGGSLSSQQQQQQRGVPSPRAGGPMAAGRGTPPPMRPLPPNAGGGIGLRRRPEQLMVGPLGDPVFAGSSGACGGGGGMGLGWGEGNNLGMETVSRVLIPNCKIGAVIGKAGAIIKHIREVSGAKVTISDSCTGLHDDSDDRMVTAAGTFNSVQLAFTHILSHAGAVGPDADPVMGLAGGDPDCVANSFRLLIPNVKAGGLIGRGGCTIKAIREQSGARIEISSHAFHFHPVHGPLPAPAHNSPTSSQGGSGHHVSPLNGGGPPNGGGAGVGGGGDGGPRGVGGNNGRFGPNIPLPPPILMDRVMTAMGSFDACLRAHHLVASKLMDVRPSPIPIPTGPPSTSHGPPNSYHGPSSHSQSAPMMIPTSSSSSPSSTSAATAAAVAAFAAAARGTGHEHGHGGGGSGPAPGMMPRTAPRSHPQHPQHQPHHGAPAFNHHDKSSMMGGGGGGPRGISKMVTASTSPASSVSEHSASYHRQPWDFDDQRSWAAATGASPSPPPPHAGHTAAGGPPMPPSAAAALCGELLSRESSSGGRRSSTSTPHLSSSLSASKGSPRGSAGSVEDFSSSATGMSDINIVGGRGVERSMLGQGRTSSSPGIGGGGGSAMDVLDHSGGGSGDSVLHQGGLCSGSDSGKNGGNDSGKDSGGAGNDGELPACLVGIMDSFFGGGCLGNNSGNTAHRHDNGNAPPPRSPSTITGIEVEVGRSAFALLGVHGLDDIKHLSGAGIIAPESIEAGAARGNAPADGFGLAASAANAAAAAAPPLPPSSSSAQAPKRASLVRAESTGASLVGSSRSLPSSSAFAPCEGYGGKKGFGAAATTPAAIAAAAEGISRLNLGGRIGDGAAGVSSSFAAAAAAAAAQNAGSGGAPGGESVGSKPHKTVRITGTAEEVQLAEYLIRVRTGRNMAAA